MMRYHSASIRLVTPLGVDENVEKLDLSYIASRVIKWYSHSETSSAVC